MKQIIFIVSLAYSLNNTIVAQEAEPFNVPESDPSASDQEVIQEDVGQAPGAGESKKSAIKAAKIEKKAELKDIQPTISPPSAGTEPAAALEGTLSDGTPVKIEGKGFSIAPPNGWQIIQTQPGLSLLLKVPPQPDLKYQRNIQVMVFSGPKYIDTPTGQEFSETIVKNYSQSFPGISDYKFRNFDEVVMADGRKGLLFYTEFKLKELAMMQALILLSGADNHYLVIYTDVAENFGEKEGGSQKFLLESWTSMTSIVIDTPTPERPNNLPLIAGIIVGFLLLGVTFALARRIRSSRIYDSFEDNVDANPPTDARTMQTLNEQTIAGDMSQHGDLDFKGEDQPISSISKYDSIFLPSKIDTKMPKKKSEDDEH